MNSSIDNIPVVATSDVVVVGGGAAGVTAAVSAARNGLSVTLLERYHHLGGMASGGMVLVLDDMINGEEIVVSGIVDEFIQRMENEGMAVTPPPEDRYASDEMYKKWARWGVHDFHQADETAADCLRDGLRSGLVEADIAGPDPRKQYRPAGCTAGSAIPSLKTALVKGVVCQTKVGRQAIMGDIVIDTTGDLDVAVRRRRGVISQGQYIVTTVFRLANVDTDEATRFEYEEPEEFAKVNRQARRIIGGAWEMWWLKTPIPGVVWCNCPHMPGYDGVSVEDLTRAEYEGRERMMGLYHFRSRQPAGIREFEHVGCSRAGRVCAPRVCSQGEYVVTKDDIVNRRYFEDTVCRGRDYYTPYQGASS